MNEGFKLNKARSGLFRTEYYKICLILLFFLLPFFDNLNGYLIFTHKIEESGLFSPSQIGRFIAFALCFPFVLKKKVYFIGFIGISLYMLTIETVFYCFHLDTHGFLYGLVNYNKLTFIYLLIVFFSYLLENNKCSTDDLTKYFVYSAFIYAILLHFATISNLGFTTYDLGTFGKRGFNSSANALGIYIGIASIASYYRFTQMKNIQNNLIFLTIFVAAFMVGNKGSLISCAIVLLIIFITLKIRNKLFAITGIMLLFSFFHEYIVKMFAIIFDVVLFRYQHAESFSKFLFSARDNFISEAFSNLDILNWHILRIITGTGTFISYREFTFSGRYRTLENDLFDLFFMYGSIVASLYAILILLSFANGIKNKNMYYVLQFSLIAFYSLFTGHVLFNGMASIVLSLSLVCVNSRQRIITYPNTM